MTNFTKDQLQLIYQSIFDSKFTGEELNRLPHLLEGGADPLYIECTIERLELLIEILQQYNLVNRDED